MSVFIATPKPLDDVTKKVLELVKDEGLDIIVTHNEDKNNILIDVEEDRILTLDILMDMADGTTMRKYSVVAPSFDSEEACDLVDNYTGGFSVWAVDKNDYQFHLWIVV